MKICDCILRMVCELFNVCCFGNVIIVDFVVECGIVEGNLWYYFKNKCELFEVLLDSFLDEVELCFVMLFSDEVSILEDYVSMLVMFVIEIWWY